MKIKTEVTEVPEETWTLEDAPNNVLLESTRSNEYRFKVGDGRYIRFDEGRAGELVYFHMDDSCQRRAIHRRAPKGTVITLETN